MRLALAGLPEGMEAPSYLESMAGALEAFLDVCLVEGRVEWEPRPGGAAFVLRWHRPAPGGGAGPG